MDNYPLFSYLFSSPLVQRNEERGYSEVDFLDYPTERRALKSIMEKKAGIHIRWKSEVANINNFLNAYSNSKILHFTGHGENGVVAFENEYGVLDFVSQEQLSEMLRAGHIQKPECVFLSACYAQTVADAFVNVGVQHVITVINDRILDKASLDFTDSFYSALLGGKSVSESFNLGIARLVAQHPTESVKFELKGHGNHDEPIFPFTDHSITNALIDITPSLPTSQCHSPAMFSIGRQCEVHQVYNLLINDMKLVNITGQKGIGKTEVALRVAEYSRERYSFSRLLFLELSNAGDCSEIACLEKLVASFCTNTSESISSLICRNDIEAVVEYIRGSIAQDEKVLLLMDGIDAWIKKKRDFLLALVSRMRQRLGESVWIVLTSQKNIDMDACREVVINSLSDIHTAKLFCMRAPRNLDRDELTLEANESHSDPIQAFSKTKLLHSMKGNPRVVELVAKELQFDGHAQNILRYETYFREEVIRNIMHQILCDQDVPSWQDVCVRIRNTYRRYVGIETSRARPLTVTDFEFFASCSAWGSDPQLVPASNGYAIQNGAYESFMTWFESVSLCLKHSCLWNRPHCIFGFINRTQAAKKLQNCDIGTFLIGVSQSEPCLVINVVTSTKKVLSVKVQFDINSPTPFSYRVNHDKVNSFMTLEDLLISNPQLRYFFPAIGEGLIEKLTLLPQT